MNNDKISYSVRVPYFIKDKLNKYWTVKTISVYSSNVNNSEYYHNVEDLFNYELTVIHAPNVELDFNVVTSLNKEETKQMLSSLYFGNIYFIDGLYGTKVLRDKDAASKFLIINNSLKNNINNTLERQRKFLLETSSKDRYRLFNIIDESESNILKEFPDTYSKVKELLK